MGSLVTADAEEEVGAAKQTSSEHRRQWRTAVRGAAAASERERAREGELTGTNGRGGRGGSGRGT